MLLRDQRKRRDTWCPGETISGSTTRGKREDASTSQEIDCSTPPSAKRHMKTRPTQVDEKMEIPSVLYTSTEEVRELFRNLMTENAEMKKKLNSTVQDKDQASLQVQNLQTDLKATIKASPLRRRSKNVSERENAKLKIQLAVTENRIEELKMEQAISLNFLTAFLKKQKRQESCPSDDHSKDPSKLQQRVLDLQNSEKEVNDVLKSEKAKCEALKKDLEYKENELQKRSTAVKELEANLKKQQALMEEKEIEIRSLRKERDGLETRLAKYEESSAIRKARVRDENQASTAKERELQSKEMDRLRKRLEDLENENKGFRRDRVDHRSEKEAFQRQIRALEKEITVLQSDTSKKESAVDRKREAVQQELHRMKERLENSQQQIEMAQATLQQSEHEAVTSKSDTLSEMLHSVCF